MVKALLVGVGRPPTPPHPGGPGNFRLATYDANRQRRNQNLTSKLLAILMAAPYETETLKMLKGKRMKTIVALALAIVCSRPAAAIYCHGQMDEKPLDIRLHIETDPQVLIQSSLRIEAADIPSLNTPCLLRTTLPTHFYCTHQTPNGPRYEIFIKYDLQHLEFKAARLLVWRNGQPEIHPLQCEDFNRDRE